MEAEKSRVTEIGYVLSVEELREILLRGKNISYLTAENSEDIEKFNKYKGDLLDVDVILKEPTNDISIEDLYEKCADEWMFPEKYQKIDVKEWLYKKCKTEEEINRVDQEYVLFEERNLIMLLRLFIYLVDYMRENNYVWGVGRGSSVSSYILYLIGIHRVNSLKFNLDIKDYLK